MRALLAACATALASFGFASSVSAGATDAHVTIEVIQCTADRDVAPSVMTAPASSFPSLAYVKAEAAAANAGPGLFELSLDLPQGNYFLKVASPHCFDTIQVGLLGGHSRRISSALFRIEPHAVAEGHFVTFGSENAIAGTLPLRPAAAWLVEAGGWKRELDLQDGAYYLERATPGTYTLRLEFHSGVQSEIPLDLTNLRSTGFAINDVTIAALEKHLGTILPNGTSEDSTWCY